MKTLKLYLEERIWLPLLTLWTIILAIFGSLYAVVVWLGTFVLCLFAPRKFALRQWAKFIQILISR